MLAATGIAVRAHPAAADPATAQLIVADSSLIPVARHFEEWGAQLAAHGFTRMRTGALGPRQALQAHAAGLQCIQELVLLEANPPLPGRSHVVRSRRGRPRDLVALAAVDRAAFGSPWHLDAAMLDDVRCATPSARVRVVTDRAVRLDESMASSAASAALCGIAGFLISGRAGQNGYVQRLAVAPHAQRRGIAAALLADALAWLRRRHVQRVFVNTHVENVPALELYRRHGFVELPDRLQVFEGPTRR